MGKPNGKITTLKHWYERTEYILKIQNEYKGVDWINLGYDRVEWQSLVNSINGRMSLVAQCSVQGHPLSFIHP